MEKELNYWKEDNKKIKVNSKLPGCSASNYYNPDLNNVSTKIEFDDEYFIPKYQSGNSSCADIFINCKEREVIDNYCFCVQQSVCKPIDCGFSIQLSKGYRACISLDHSLSSNGLILVKNSIIDPGKLERVNIYVLNIGEKQLILNHKDKIGKIWVEPIYFFEWM